MDEEVSGWDPGSARCGHGTAGHVEDASRATCATLRQPGKNLPPPSAEQKSRKLERFLLSASFLWFQQKKNLSEISFSKKFLKIFKKLI